MRLVGLHHATFAVTNLQETERFATDFGLKTVSRDDGRLFMRTEGGDAYSYIAVQAVARAFKGFAFSVESREDLTEAIRRHGASPVRGLDAPGGGEAVTLINPEGIHIDLVYGISEELPNVAPPSLALNTPGAAKRLDAPQNGRALNPAHLYRLGHIGFFVKDYKKSATWYQNVLGLLVSDTIYRGDPSNTIVGFLRLNRDAEYVDHHCIFLGQLGKSDCHHISFEVQDFEAQFMAHRWLKLRGWTPSWGVGRHPLGSHVFDLWFDPDGFRFETFSDTDLVRGNREAVAHDFHKTEIDMWSSASPEAYFK